MKRAITALVFIFISQLCFTQTLSGYYREFWGDISYSDVQYRFYEDGSFKHEIHDDVGFFIGMGKYEISSKGITLTYEKVPEWIKHSEIIRERSEDSLTSIALLNPWDDYKPTPYTYRILEGENEISRGRSDDFGRIFVDLKDGQKVEIFAGGFEHPSVLVSPYVLEVDASSWCEDIVILNSGFYSPPATIYRTGTHKLRSLRKDKGFKIHKHGRWISYLKRKI